MFVENMILEAAGQAVNAEKPFGARGKKQPGGRRQPPRPAQDVDKVNRLAER